MGGLGLQYRSECFCPRARTALHFPVSLADSGAGAERWGLGGPAWGRWSGGLTDGRCLHAGQVGVALGPVL